MLLLYVWMNLYQECFNKNTRCSLQSMNKKEGIPITTWKLYTIYKDLAITADESLLPLFRNLISVQEFYVAKSKSGKLQLITTIIILSMTFMCGVCARACVYIFILFII